MRLMRRARFADDDDARDEGRESASDSLIPSRQSSQSHPATCDQETEAARIETYSRKERHFLLNLVLRT